MNAERPEIRQSEGVKLHSRNLTTNCTSSDNVCWGVHVWSVVQSCIFLRALHFRCKCSLTPPYTSLTVVFICVWCSALHYFFYNEEHLNGWISTLSIARQRTTKAGRYPVLQKNAELQRCITPSCQKTSLIADHEDVKIWKSHVDTLLETFTTTTTSTYKLKTSKHHNPYSSSTRRWPTEISRHELT